MKTVEFNSNFNTESRPRFDLDGSGAGVGLNLSLLFVSGDWSVGAAYHSSANISIDGNIKTNANTGLPSDNVVTDLEVPWRFQVGVRNQTTDRLAIEFDFTRTGWSSFDKLEVKNEEYGKTIFTSTNDWNDANAYRLGLSYDVSDAIQLRAGYTHDQTPQDDDHFSPRVPDADRNLYSFGAGFKIPDGWTIDASYMLVKFEDRKIDQPEWDAETEEYNGTSAVNGDYRSSVSLLSLGVSKTF
jgi:long-chain fatty acid transport protein